MPSLLSFDQLYQRANALRQPVPVAVAGGADPTVLRALQTAWERGCASLGASWTERFAVAYHAENTLQASLEPTNEGGPMRLLVQCPHCKRQYDASRRSVGSRFRCHCGHLVQVQQPKGHDARVVHCSSCGAARTENSDVCPYCQSEFTLHERDLNTVCPSCLARVSDSARFCHQCGTGLVPELDAGEDTDLLCPACAGKHRLVSRRLGREHVAVLECGRCGGFWLGHEAFRQLVERALHEALPFGTVAPPPAGSAGRGLQQHRRGRFYRPCVVCGELMNRLNYGRVSGVIIDACKDHGIWFDAKALTRILDWIHKCGAEVSARVEELDRQEKARTANTLEHRPSPHHFLDVLLETLLEAQ